MKRQSLQTLLEALAGISALTLAATVPVTGARAQYGSGSSTQNSHSKEAIRDVPRLKEKQVVTATGSEDWAAVTGFGKDATMAEMMTLMMVAGSGMEHMKMGPMKPGMKMPGMNMANMPGMAMDHAQGLPVTATLKQNPPNVGDNTMDLLVTDASGKPVTGLKLMATVAMTSMDMGTTKPKATEGKNGHYSLTTTFSMKGPWRVMLMNDGMADKNTAVHSTLDFNVDGKTKWTQPKPMAGMKMSADAKVATQAATNDVKTTSGAPAATKDVTTPTGGQQAVKNTKTVAGEQATTNDAKTPLTDSGPVKDVKPPVGGAPPGGYKITVNTDPKSLKTGKNTLDLTIMDTSGKPVTGVKVTGAVEMTSMDMGVTKPTAKEGKSGHYNLPVEFAMKGPWRVTLTVTPPKQKPFTKAFEFKIAQ